MMSSIITGEKITDIPTYVQGVLPDIKLRYAQHFVESGGAGRIVGTVLADNYDILVQEDTGRKGYNDPDTTYSTPIFGDLYSMSNGVVTDEQGTQFNLFYYPSASVTNSMLEEIGLRPAVDVTAFTLVSDDNFSHELTHWLFANRKHGISADPSFFEHDRGKTHAIGSLAMHPRLLSTISARVMETHPHSEKGRRVVEDAHDFSNYISILTNKIYKTGQRSDVYGITLSDKPGLFRHAGARFLLSGHVPLLRPLEIAKLQNERYQELEELVATYRRRNGN